MDAVRQIICIALTVAWILLFVRVILSWVVFLGLQPPSTGFLRTAWDLLMDVTEPPLRLLRRIVPPAGMFDLSVVVAFVVILVLQIALC